MIIIMKRSGFEFWLMLIAMEVMIEDGTLKGLSMGGHSKARA